MECHTRNGKRNIKLPLIEMNVLLTGAAGFIGFHTGMLLLKKGYKVFGVDNLNDYYDLNLKKNRLKELKKNKNFFFINSDIQKKKLKLKVKKINVRSKINCIINLAAQAGVRHSLVDPYSYVDSNVMGQLNMLEIAKELNISKYIYASSSSVYGGNKVLPFSTKQRVDNPVSLYAATKKSTELLAECYSKLFDLHAIGLRFFTVYGPWGRPDMATFIFTKRILENKKIDIFNFGKMKRDFTYVDDIVNGINGAIDFKSNKESSHKVYNLGNNNSEELMKFIEIIEKNLEIKSNKNFLPMQPGDVKETYADILESERDLNFKPNTRIEDGIPEFIKWYKEYYNIKISTKS